jgi:hypothetical protein
MTISASGPNSVAVFELPLTLTSRLEGRVATISPSVVVVAGTGAVSTTFGTGRISIGTRARTSIGGELASTARKECKTGARMKIPVNGVSGVEMTGMLRG